ncbi:MAG: nucleotidyltransferase family protein [Anaerolineae bacterium]|nr:nucleotidyltransferase family protein [Anaerolineae bacterium]MDW8071570.1 nucleotidyltransferase family protein [Anaerolineae bacterium]
MKAMILAAGEGTRLRPLTEQCPKPMLPVAGRPLLEHTLAWLQRYGIREVAINLHHLPEAIRGYFGDGSRFGMRITYSPEEQLLGTAGAVRRLEHFFNETFVVVYGDVLTDLDLAALLRFHREHQGIGTITLYRVNNPTACGLVELDWDGRVVRFIEKPRPEEVFTNLANAGVYILEPEVIAQIPPEGASDFGRDVFPALLERGLTLYGYIIPATTRLIDIGSPEHYRLAQELFGQHVDGEHS